jgi:hypothetical protein
METNNNPQYTPRQHSRDLLIACLITAIVMGMIGWVYFDYELRMKEKQIEDLKNAQTQQSQQQSPTSYTYPYRKGPLKEVSTFSIQYVDPSLSWTDDSDNKFTIKKLTYGDYEVASANVATNSLKDPYYSQGQILKALVVNLSLETGAGSNCLGIPGNFEIQEFAGTHTISPLNRQLYFPDSGGCNARANSNYQDIELYFPLGEYEILGNFIPVINDPLYTTKFEIYILKDNKLFQVSKKLVSKLTK